jgi:hypothetical protein
MEDQKPHTVENCIFAKSDWQVFADPKTGEILYLSPLSTKLLLLSQKPAPVLTEQEKENHLETVIVGDQLKAAASPAVNLKGRQILDFITPSFAKNHQEGVIIPVELNNSENPDYSKWIFACTHSSTDPHGKGVVMWSFEDVDGLKTQLKETLKHPLKIENIKKVSVAIPDFILDQKTKLGQSLCLRLNPKGIVTQMYPFESFLGVVRHKIIGQNLLGLIQSEDQLVMTQVLSESFKVGRCNVLIRWGNYQNWVQIKVSCEKTTNSFVLVFQEVQDINQQQSYADQAWGMFSSATTNATQLSSAALQNANKLSTTAIQSASENAANARKNLGKLLTVPIAPRGIFSAPLHSATLGSSIYSYFSKSTTTPQPPAIPVAPETETQMEAIKDIQEKKEPTM